MNSEHNTKLLVCVHKAGTFLNDGHYMPVQVGKAASTTELPIQGDDTGENISRKNPSYCELTALYWAWKNLKPTDYIGLCHYRRYFDFTPFHYRERYLIRAEQLGKSQRLPGLEKLFRKYDIVLPVSMVFGESLREHYAKHHIGKDVDVLREVIEKLTPDYLDAFDSIMDRSNQLAGYNMFLSRWETFDRYCGWLFPVLSELEKRIDISDDPYQARIFGFLGERLLNVYCRRHRLRVKYYPIVLVDEENTDKRCIFSYWWTRLKIKGTYRIKRILFRK